MRKHCKYRIRGALQRYKNAPSNRSIVKSWKVLCSSFLHDLWFDRMSSGVLVRICALCYRFLRVYLISMHNHSVQASHIGHFSKTREQATFAVNRAGNSALCNKGYALRKLECISNRESLFSLQFCCALTINTRTASADCVSVYNVKV